MYIVIGDGGNEEGPSTYSAPPAVWTAFRESSFGHGIFRVRLCGSPRHTQPAAQVMHSCTCPGIPDTSSCWLCSTLHHLEVTIPFTAARAL